MADKAVSDRVYQHVGVERGSPLPQYTSPGSYTILYLTRNGDDVCAKCATSYDNSDDPITQAGTYDEGPTLECVVCACDIESSYGPVSES